jgi:hypothetical protein
MLVRDLGQGGKWYVVAAHYPTATMAKKAWERLNAKLDMRAGDEGIGITRLAPNPGPDTIASGVPAGRHSVVGVTLHAFTAIKTKRLLSDGTAWQPSTQFADALIIRRARIVQEQTRRRPGATGRVVIRRPEGRGASLRPTGETDEPEPGQG